MRGETTGGFRGSCGKEGPTLSLCQSPLRAPALLLSCRGLQSSRSAHMRAVPGEAVRERAWAGSGWPKPLTAAQVWCPVVQAPHPHPEFSRLSYSSVRQEVAIQAGPKSCLPPLPVNRVKRKARRRNEEEEEGARRQEGGSSSDEGSDSSSSSSESEMTSETEEEQVEPASWRKNSECLGIEKGLWAHGPGPSTLWARPRCFLTALMGQGTPLPHSHPIFPSSLPVAKVPLQP